MDLIREQTLRLLTRTLFYGARVSVQISEPSLARHLQDALESLIRSMAADEPDVQALNTCLQELRRGFEDAGLLNAAPLNDLLLAERHALLLQLHISQRPVRRHSSPSVRASTTRPRPSARSAEHAVGLSAQAGNGNGSANGRITGAMRQVLTALRGSEPSRSRDIITRCRPLSERTVKRSLQGLVTAGLVSKEMQDGTILYRAAQDSA